MITVGRVGSTDYGQLDADENGNIPIHWQNLGYVAVSNQPSRPTGQFGDFWLQEDLTWLFIRTYPVIQNQVLYEAITSQGSERIRYENQWGQKTYLTPAFLGAATLEQVTSGDSSVLTTAKAYADAVLSAYLAKMADVVVTTDASGNWTYNYSSKGYTVAPVVTYGIEATGGHTINITSRTTTSVSGVVSKPKSAVLGVLPYEAAGAGIKVNLHIKPAT